MSEDMFTRRAAKNALLIEIVPARGRKQSLNLATLLFTAACDCEFKDNYPNLLSIPAAIER